MRGVDRVGKVEDSSPFDKVVFHHVYENWFLNSKPVKNWWNAEQSGVLILTADKDYGIDVSVFSFISKEVQLHFQRKGVMVLNWYCNFYNEADSLTMMMRNLIGQTLQLRKDLAFEEKPPRDFVSLLSSLLDFIRFELRRHDVVCIVDCVQHYLQGDRGAHTQDLLWALASIVNENDPKRQYNFRLLISHTRSYTLGWNVAGRIDEDTIPGSVVDEGILKAGAKHPKGPLGARK
jgi:hypothetical protein